MRSFTAICVLSITGALVVGLTLNGYNHVPPAPDPPTYDHPPPLVSQPGLIMAGPYHNPHRRTVRYRITTLHHTSDDEPMHLNNSGDILCGTDFSHGGKWTSLKVSEVSGLNDGGTVVGDILSDTSGAYTVYYSKVVTWQNGQVRVLPNQPPAALRPNAINNRGDIIATTFESGDDPDQEPDRTYLYSQGKFTDLGVGDALCFNDKEQIVFQATPYSYFTLWENGRSHPLGVRFGTPSLINNHGQIVGALETGQTSHVYAEEVSHAFFWQQGRTRDLGTLGGDNSVALGLSNHGEVVGKADTSLPGNKDDAPTHAFLWRDGQMHDLNDLIPKHSGWTLTEADAINDRGQIVGVGSRGSFLLTPVRR